MMKPDQRDESAMGRQNQEGTESRIREYVEAIAGMVMMTRIKKNEPAGDTTDITTTEAIAGAVKKGRLSDMSASRGIRKNAI